jgi:hypothetical protein
MPRSNSRGGRNSNSGGQNNNPTGRNQYSDWGVMELARERPFAAAAAAAGAAAAGLFLWSRRAQISNQLSSLSDQVGEWSDRFRSDSEFGEFGETDDTAGLTTSGQTGATTSRQRGMSETGAGNASLGRRSGGGGTRANSTSRGRGQGIPSTT